VFRRHTDIHCIVFAHNDVDKTFVEAKMTVLRVFKSV